MKVTLRDVAKAAGVGVSTASYVLNESGLHKVSAETCQRIRDVAEKLNYTPNAIARGLRSGKSYLVGVMVPAIDFSFMPSIIAGIDRVLSLNKYNMLLCTYSSIEELKSKRDLMRQKQVDGIILKTWFDQMPQAVEICSSGNMPCVSVATPYVKNIPGVWVDPAAMGYAAYDYLYKAGHRRIALCNLNSSSDWVKIVTDRIRQDKSVEYIFCSAEDPDWCSRIFEHVPEVTAVVAPDMMAIKVLNEAYTRHIAVPEALSVLAMDGADIEQFTIPPLTSIIQPRTEQGEEAARLLLEWINTRQMPGNVVLQPMIRERASVCSC